MNAMVRLIVCASLDGCEIYITQGGAPKARGSADALGAPNE